nr:hypothetical protein CFP56_63504 [Quercus suber]
MATARGRVRAVMYSHRHDHQPQTAFTPSQSSPKRSSPGGIGASSRPVTATSSFSALIAHLARWMLGMLSSCALPTVVCLCTGRDRISSGTDVFSFDARNFQDVRWRPDAMDLQPSVFGSVWLQGEHGLPTLGIGVGSEKDDDPSSSVESDAE